MAPAQANIIPINAWKAELEIAYFVGIQILKQTSYIQYKIYHKICKTVHNSYKRMNNLQAKILHS